MNAPQLRTSGARFARRFYRLQRSRWGYAVAVLAVASATGIQALLDVAVHIGATPFIVYPLAIAASALWGFGPGALSVVLSTMVANILFVEPQYRISIDDDFLVLSPVFALTQLAVARVVSWWVSAASSAADALEWSDILAETGLRLHEAETIPGAVGALRDLYVPAWADSFAVEFDTEIDTHQPKPGASVLAVPLRSGPERFGRVVFVREAGRGPFAARERSNAEDIGRRIGARFRAIRLVDELRAANETKAAFLGMVGHELRTPITIISGYADALEGRSGTADGELIPELAVEASRLRGLVENMLLFARAEGGREIPSSSEPILLQRVLPRLSERFARRANREVRCVVPAGLPPVLGDERHLEQILENLVSNGAKYSSDGAPVEIEAEAAVDAHVCVSVLDRGDGIPEDKAEAIFAPFYRLEGTAASGAGLGLSICRLLAEAMDGRIEFIPRDGGGSRFALYLRVVDSAETDGTA